MKLLFIIAFLAGFPSLATAQNTALITKLPCPDRVRDVAYSPDGKLIAAGFGWDRQAGARVWNVADYKVVANLSTGNGEGANVERIAFSPDGKLFVVVNWSGDVIVWNVGSWNSRRRIHKSRGEPKSISFSPDSSKLAIATEIAVIIYDFNYGRAKTLTMRTNAQESFTAVSFSRRDNTLFVFTGGSIQTWDVVNGKLISQLPAASASFFGDVSRNGNFVLAGGGAIFGKKLVQIWKVTDQQKIAELTALRNGLFGVAISQSEKLFALSGGDYGAGGQLSLWTINDPHEIGFVSFGEFPFKTLSFSGDDKVLAVASDDGYVLLYDVDRIRGPEVKKQNHALCGEVVKEDAKVYLVPLSKVPVPMRPNFQFAWEAEILNGDLVAGLAGQPVMLSDWSIESSADDKRARINKFRSLLPANASKQNLNHIVFADIQNPGWDEGFIVKIYEDGSFVGTNAFGRCLAQGTLAELQTDFESISKRLMSAGLLAVEKEPTALGADHYRTRFIELKLNGVAELRSDAEPVERLLKGGPAKKREEFERIFNQEDAFIKALLSRKLP